jgi:hypothetical protein
MKASGMSKEAIDIEKRAFLDHSAALQSEIKVLLHDQAIYTDTQIQGVQDRIDSLAIEGEAWYKYSQIVKKAMETWAWAMDKQIAGKKILYNNMPSFMNDQKSKLGESLQEDIDFRESLRGASVEPLNEVINKYKNELSELKVKRNNLLLQSVKGLGFNSEGGLGGSEVGDDDKKKKNGSTGRASTPSTEPIQRALLNREVDHSFEEAKKSANAYEEALANVKHQEDIYGTSATSFAKSLQIKKDRYFELGKELEGYEALSNKYLAAVDNATVGSEDFLNKFSITAEQWAAMTKEQKKSFMSAYSEQNQEMKTTIQLLDLLDKVEVKVSEVRKKRSSLNNEVEMDSIVNIHKVYQEKMNTLEADKDHDIASLGYNAPQLAKNVKEYRYAVDELTLAEAELTRMEKEGLVDTETWQRQRAEVDKLKLKVQELGDRWQGIRQATADTFIDMAINGNSFKDIWKKLWADLAKEAIYRLLQVKTQASLLGSIFNLLGPKAGVIGSAEMAEIDVAAANVPLEIMHSGGVVGGSNPVVPYLKSDEVNRTLQVGEEVNSIKDRRTTEIMADQNKYLMDKLESVSQNGQPVQFTIVTPDTGSFAEYLRQHGDVLVNILREQGGLRNNT